MMCSICLEPLSSHDDDKEEEEETLACQHKYHSKCIEKWMMHHSTCPMCRKSMGFSREELMEICYKIERNSFYLLMLVLVSIQLGLWIYSISI